MCGRFTQTQSWMKLKRRFELKEAARDIKPRYNIAPTQNAAVIVKEGRAPVMKFFRWGLIPSWAKDPSIGNQMINARAETIAEKPSFRKSFKSRRCLVPADGFYEWRPGERRGRKTPMRIQRPKGGLFAFAGLWDEWAPEGREPVRTFTIVTTAANHYLESVHDRMPVILDSSAEKTWMDPAIQDAAILSPLLRPAPNDFLTAFEVSRSVNSPSIDTPELILPAAQRPRELF